MTPPVRPLLVVGPLLVALLICLSVIISQHGGKLHFMLLSEHLFRCLVRFELLTCDLKRLNLNCVLSCVELCTKFLFQLNWPNDKYYFFLHFFNIYVHHAFLFTCIISFKRKTCIERKIYIPWHFKFWNQITTFFDA